jgi:hypothetical protein
MAPDPTNIYFFYNIYGDADELLATKPSNAIAVPFGWDPETEQKRNEILAELNASVSGLPSVLYYRAEYEVTLPDGTTMIVPAHWEEFDFWDLPKPWSWSQYAPL